MAMVSAVCLPSCNSGGSAAQGTPQDSLGADSAISMVDSPVSKPLPAVAFDIHDLFKPENSDVVNLLADENYAEAAQKATKFINATDKGLTETQLANLRYMHLYATGGLATTGKKKHKDVEALLQEYQGKLLITQHLPVTSGPGQPFNQVKVEQDSPDTLSVSCANNKGYNIICFVRVVMKARPKLSEHLGKEAYLMGRLDSFKVSNQSINSWIFDMTLADGELHILEDEFGE